MTDDIRHRIVEAAERDKVDASLVERNRWRHRRGDDVALVSVLDSTGEAKSKPLQHSVQELRRIGIQPDVIIARTRHLLADELRAKIALFASVPEDSVFSSPNLPSTYLLPESLDEQGLGDKICKRLGSRCSKPNWGRWERVVRPMIEPRHRPGRG